MTRLHANSAATQFTPRHRQCRAMERAATCLLGLSILFGMTACSGSMNASEKMMWSTYPLTTVKGSATGFIINHPDPHSPGNTLPVVFTSAHLLETMGKGPLIIGVRRAGELDTVETALLVFIPPKTAGKECFYVRHPKSDLVAFALHLPEEIGGRDLMPSFLDERALARSGKVLRSGADVSFFGYPEVVPGTEGAFPVLRSGRVASYPMGTSMSQGRFIINSDVYPGDSGAPVMVSNQGNHPEVVGMIIQRIGPESQKFAHFAIAVDADALRETLQLLELQEIRAVEAEKPEGKERGAPDQTHKNGHK